MNYFYEHYEYCPKCKRVQNKKRNDRGKRFGSWELKIG